MKYLVCLASTWLLLGCQGFGGAGTLGGGYLYKYDCTRGELQNCLENIKIKNSAYNVPKNWEDFNDWSAGGFDFLNGITYFLNESQYQKKEMYYVTLVQNDYYDTVYTKPSLVALRSVFNVVDGKPRWLHLHDLNKTNKDRVELRFQQEILSKIKSASCSCKLIEIEKDED